MSTYSYDDNDGQYAQYLDNGNETFYPSMSPPIIPPLVDREWGQFPSQSYPSTTPTTATASPNSLYFPQTFVYGSSVGASRSYPATPLSSISSNTSRNNLPSHYQTLQMCLTDVDTSKQTKIIVEDPSIPRPKADKSRRSCMLCFTNKWKCPGSEPDRCTHCLSRTTYCKGPILNPKLIDIERLYDTAAAFLAARFRSQNLLPASHFSISLEIHMRLRPLPGSTVAPDDQTYEFCIPELRNDFRFRWDPRKIDNVLDALIAAEPVRIPDPSPLNSYDLDLYKRLCRRFCHCVSILRSLDRCTLEYADPNHPRALHIVIGFICQVSRTASSIFVQIFDQVRLCCFARRPRQPTAKHMFTLTDHLGEMCKEIKCLSETLEHSDTPSLLHGFFFDANATFKYIEDLARGLRVEPFNFARRSAPLTLGGMHVTIPDCPGFVTRLNSASQETKTSFLDVLAHSASLVPCHKDYVTSTAVNEFSYTGGYEEGMNEPSQTVENEILSARHDISSRGKPQHSTCDQDSVINDHTASEMVHLQAEADASLNPNWSLPLDFTSIPGGVTMTVSEPQPQGSSGVTLGDALYPLAWIEPGYPLTFQDYYPINTNPSDNTLAPFPAMMGYSQNEGPILNTIDPTDTLATDTLLQPSPYHSQVTKKPSKRKRMSSFLSRKKQNIAAAQVDETEPYKAPGRPSSSKATNTKPSPFKRTPVLPESAATKDKSKGRALRTFKTDWGAEWVKPDDAGPVECDRRPMSWPLRQHFRKSIDILLTRPFEKKLRIEDAGPL